MRIKLFEGLQGATEELLRVLPLDKAMPELCPKEPRTDEAYGIGIRAAQEREPTCAAGIWLYVDDLDRAHALAQTLDGPIGALWHSIVHRREGDIWNAHYWLKQAKPMPIAFEGYDAGKLIDEVALHRGESPAALLDLQRAEWAHLFAHCVGGTLVA